MSVINSHQIITKDSALLIFARSRAGVIITHYFRSSKIYYPKITREAGEMRRETSDYYLLTFGLYDYDSGESTLLGNFGIFVCSVSVQETRFKKLVKRIS